MMGSMADRKGLMGADRTHEVLVMAHNGKMFMRQLDEEGRRWMKSSWPMAISEEHEACHTQPARRMDERGDQVQDRWRHWIQRLVGLRDGF